MLCPHWCSEPRGPDPEPRPRRSQLRNNITAQNPEVSGQSPGISTKHIQMSPTEAWGFSQAVGHAAEYSFSSTQRHPAQNFAWTPLETGCSLPPLTSLLAMRYSLEAFPESEFLSASHHRHGQKYPQLPVSPHHLTLQSYAKGSLGQTCLFTKCTHPPSHCLERGQG